MAHPKMIWPCINYRDAPAVIEFLTVAFGFVVNVAHRTGDHVEHAELLFPEGGGVMLGSASSDGTPSNDCPPDPAARISPPTTRLGSIALPLGQE
jgi:uncharacterized glyoxalase superfamily protein PhnB